MTSFDVYLFTRLDSVQAAVLIIFILSLIAVVVLGIKTLIDLDFDDDIKGQAKVLKILIPVTAVFALLWCLTPSTKEAAAIYLLPRIVNNDQVQQVPENMLNLLNAKFRQWIEDIEKETNNTKIPKTEGAPK